MLAAGNPNGLEELLSPGVESEGIIVPAGQLRWPNASDDPGELAFLIIESEQLLHHVTETLLRLLLAHAQRQSCPWLAVSSLKSFGKFKRQIAELAADPWPSETRRRSDSVFLGHPWSGTAPDQDDRAGAATERITRILAATYLERANVYNAVKHGLAVQAANATVTFAPSGSSQAAFSAGGPAITILEHRDAGPTREWYQRTAWVDVSTNIWLTHLALIQMQALWNVGRARYTQAVIEQVETVSR